MGNNASNDRIVSSLLLGCQNGSISEPSLCDGPQSLEEVNLLQSQNEYSQTYPVMLFESSTDFVDLLPIIDPDGVA
jgi:hypothetical protein